MTCGQGHEQTFVDQRFGCGRCGLRKTTGGTKGGVVMYFQPGYKASLARFPGDPQGHCETQSQWDRLRDKRKRQGWKEVDTSSLHTPGKMSKPTAARGKKKKPLLNL